MEIHNQLGLPRNSTTYKISGTETFRLSSAAILDTYGGNLQNVEKSMRRIYVADAGYSFVQVDQGGAEALVVSYLAPAGQLRDLFTFGIKPHTFVALHVFANEWRRYFPDKNVVEAALKAKISELRSIPGWSDLDKLIRKSDDWESNKRYYFLGKKIVHACLTPDHEVLTRDGWVRIDSIKENIDIAIWNKQTKDITFEIPRAWNKYSYDGNVIEFKEPQFSQVVTPNHKMPWMAYDGSIKDRTAVELLKLNECRLPTCGNYIGGNSNLTPDQARLIAAYQADGCVRRKGSITFRFIKKRKIERILKLLKNLQLKYHYYVDDNCVHNIIVENVSNIIDFLGEPKRFSSKLLTLSKEALRALVDEVKYWDGSTEEEYLHKRVAYYSAHIENVKWIKTALHLCGQQGTLNKHKDGTYALGINIRNYSRIHRGSVIPFSGYVYCPTVSTGYFIIRHKGKISITGNSNYGMMANTFVMSVLEETEGLIALNTRDAENYLGTYHKLFPEVGRWHLSVQRDVKTYRMLRNLFGFPFKFTGYVGESMWKEAYAFVPQSTVGTITNIAFTQFQNYIEDNNRNWHLLANTHDSYLAECPDADIEECARKMKEFIEVELVGTDGTKFRMRSEAVAGKNWAPYKKGKNEDGLKEVVLK